MLTCCNTARGRVACGLGGALIAALALACLWAFSPAVTAGDDPPAKTKASACPEPGLPDIPVKKVKAELVDSATLPPVPPPIDYPKLPPKPDVSTAPPPLPGESLPPPPSIPPLTGTGATKAPAPPPPSPPAVDSPLPPSTGPITPVTGYPEGRPITPVVGTLPQGVQLPVDAQDIKQLVAQLSRIRAERTKLDEQERQTIQGIKRKYQEQKHALEQLDRELRQLGITCDETPPPDKAPEPPLQGTGRTGRYR
jgi:hypothetical protein